MIFFFERYAKLLTKTKIGTYQFTAAAVMLFIESHHLHFPTLALRLQYDHFLNTARMCVVVLKTYSSVCGVMSCGDPQRRTGCNLKQRCIAIRTVTSPISASTSSCI